MKTVIVTGAAGFIGSNLAQKLLGDGKYRVVGVDNMDNTYSRVFKEEHIKPLKEDKNFVFYEEDVCEFDKMKEIFEKEKPDYVIHLAGRVDTRDSVNEAYEYIRVNVFGSLNMLELSKDFKVQNFVFASSSSIYGNDAKIPFKEADFAGRPISPYGVTKQSVELLAYTYNRNFGLNVICLRFFNVYGENNRPSMVPYVWVEKILKGEQIEVSGDGERKRDYTYIGDTVDGIIKAMEVKDIGFEIINIGGGKSYTLNELVSAFEKSTGIIAKVKSRPSHDASVNETSADTTKAKELLGWEPKVNLEEGIDRLVNWFRDNRL